MSFGEPGGWSQELLAQTVSNAVLKSGKTVAVRTSCSTVRTELRRARRSPWATRREKAVRATFSQFVLARSA
jgi:hypothetical protein